MKKKLSTVGVLFALITSVINSPIAFGSYGFPDEIFSPTSNNYSEVLTENSSGWTVNQSYIQAGNRPDPKTGKGGGNFVCDSFDDINCSSRDSTSAHLLLSPCAQTESPFCIEDVAIKVPGNPNSESLRLIREIQTKRVAASPLSGIPAGGSASLWKGSGSQIYVVVASIKYSRYQKIPAHFDGVDAKVFPAEIIENPAYVSSVLSTSKPDQSEIPNMVPEPTRPVTLDQQKCFIAAEAMCVVKEDFKSEVDISLSLKLPSAVSGWLFGRMKNSSVALTPLSASMSRLVVSGATATVPNLIVSMTKTEVLNHKKFVEWTKANGYNNGEDVFNRLKQSGSMIGGTNLVNAFWAVDIWGEDLKAYSGPDKLFALSTAWNFGAVSANLFPPKCTKDSTLFLGMVTTNAPIYESDPPKFEGGFLKYKVAGPHFEADQKTLFRGVYDLNLTSEFARCLYGFTSAPISATISVTNNDGSSQEVTTEVMSEKNGMIHLGAYNFHFSSPTVKVKFSQEKIAQAAAPTPKASTSTKKTITCIKGNVKKKVTTSKCPTGFKKIT